MRILFYAGMFLIALGLLAAAVETGAHGLSGADQGFLMSAHDLWYTLRPKSLLVFEIRAERIAPRLWNPVMMSVLKIPAWAIFGVPGGLLVWFSRVGHIGKSDDDIHEVLESFRLFDDLTRQARTESPEAEEPEADESSDLIDGGRR